MKAINYTKINVNKLIFTYSLLYIKVRSCIYYTYATRRAHRTAHHHGWIALSLPIP